MNKKGLLVVYTGCSGVGKGTIMKEMLQKESSLRLSVSATTRDPRPGETHGKEYFFVSREEFKEMINNNKFLEYAQYADNFYGTPKDAVEEMLNQGLNVILEIEVQGGLQVLEKCPDCLSIFIVPPSMEELENRLRGRGTEPNDVIEKRMEAAKTEMTFTNRYDYVVMNDKVDTAVEEIISLIKKEQDKRNS
ncbi:MAG: guanylate kinase [Oscillospiraceae bacterium]|nr:guanylate kinase [Oscillospiraceae bacterium]